MAHRTPIIEVLVVDDNIGDSELTMHLLGQHDPFVHLRSVGDGIEAMLFLRHEGKHSTAITPDLIMLDLNMPRKNGWEVLGEVKSDSLLKLISVVIFTASQTQTDIARCYGLGANSFVSKPENLAGYKAVMAAIASYWFDISSLVRQGEI